MSESGVGKGGFCGAAFLNQAFEEHVKGRLGEEEFARMDPRTWQVALQTFEDRIKKNFKDDGGRSFNVPFPGLVSHQ